jgi:hypothetical protein
MPTSTLGIETLAFQQPYCFNELLSFGAKSLYFSLKKKVHILHQTWCITPLSSKKDFSHDNLVIQVS